MGIARRDLLRWGAGAGGAAAVGSLFGPVSSATARTAASSATPGGLPTDSWMSRLDGSLSLLDLTLYEKQIRGALFGSSAAQHDIPRLLEMHNLGQLKLRELITKEYSLDQVNEGYEDMRAGRNIRGLIRYR